MEIFLIPVGNGLDDESRLVLPLLIPASLVLLLEYLSEQILILDSLQYLINVNETFAK